MPALIVRFPLELLSNVNASASFNCAVPSAPVSVSAPKDFPAEVTVTVLPDAGVKVVSRLVAVNVIPDASLNVLPATVSVALWVNVPVYPVASKLPIVSVLSIVATDPFELVSNTTLSAEDAGAHEQAAPPLEVAQGPVPDASDQFLVSAARQ